MLNVDREVRALSGPERGGWLELEQTQLSHPPDIEHRRDAPAEADHGLDREADAERVGDRDDLEDVGLEEALHSKADRRLTEVDPFGQICEVGTSVQLECRDDLEVLLIEVRRVGGALSDGIPLL